MDLGFEAQITNVVVYNRLDCCGNRLLNAELQILDADNVVVAVQPFGPEQDVYHFNFDRVVGHIVKVNKQERSVFGFNIVEVEVFGNTLPVPGFCLCVE